MKWWNQKRACPASFPSGANTVWRRGTNSFEVIVSFTLLSSVLAFATPLVVRHSRLLAGQRHYRLALDELSNQVERLSALPADQVSAAVENLAPSEFAAKHLPGAELHGELAEAEPGQRLTLHLTWDEPQRKSAPLRLTTWIGSESSGADSLPARREQP
jgi:hypothetical protein